MSRPTERGGQTPSAEAKTSRIEEETPGMRSVSFLKTPSLDEHTKLFDGKEANSIGLDFGKLPKPGIPRSASSKLEVANEWSGCRLWNVKELELVPEGFPLERTHREIYDDPATVASRISEALRRLSIQTEFCSEKAKAKCRTNDLVCFRIRLYAGNESGEPVIVEIQRRNGPVGSFMSSCRAILDAAEGKEQKPMRLPPAFSKPICQMKCLQNVTLPARTSGVGTLSSTCEMLRSNNRDTNVLGLESLCCLTDPVKTSAACALKASKDLIVNGESDKLNLREEIRVLTERDSFGPEDHLSAQSADRVRHLSLAILSNALAMCGKDGCLADAVKQQQWFAEFLIPSLLDELKRVGEASTNDSYLAVSCLQSLVSSSDFARKVVVENDGIILLQKAHDFGSLRHELLAIETKRCLEEFS